MGCDIHGPYIEALAYEARDGRGPVWYNVAVMDGKRDYRLFGLLADVRGRCRPVIQTHRGYPDDPDYLLRGHINGGGCHSASWATLDEMRAVAEAYRTAGPDLDDPDGEPVPDMSGWWSEADAIAALMAEVEARGGKPTRAVFCFDN